MKIGPTSFETFREANRAAGSSDKKLEFPTPEMQRQFLEFLSQRGVERPRLEEIYFPSLNRVIPVLKSDQHSVMNAKDSTALFLHLIDQLDLEGKSIFNLGSYHGALAVALSRKIAHSGELLATDLQKEAVVNTRLSLEREWRDNPSLRDRIHIQSMNMHEGFLEARLKTKFDCIIFNNPIFKLSSTDSNSSCGEDSHLVQVTLMLLGRHLADKGEAYLLTAEPDKSSDSKYFKPQDLENLVEEYNSKDLRSRKLELDFPEGLSLKGSREAATYQIARIRIKNSS